MKYLQQQDFCSSQASNFRRHLQKFFKHQTQIRKKHHGFCDQFLVTQQSSGFSGSTMDCPQGSGVGPNVQNMVIPCCFFCDLSPQIAHRYHDFTPWPKYDHIWSNVMGKQMFFADMYVGLVSKDWHRSNLLSGCHDVSLVPIGESGSIALWRFLQRTVLKRECIEWYRSFANGRVGRVNEYQPQVFV